MDSPQPKQEHSPTTEDLVARSGGDREGAFGDLYRRVAPAVFAWAALHLHAPLRAQIDPEDVLQEAACRAYERFDTYDVERGDFRGWLFGFARNVLYQAMERLRSTDVAQPTRLNSLPDTATSITSRIARDEGLAAFIAMIEKLPDEDRRLLSYRGLEGLSHERVAELMGLTPDAVMQRWSRLRARLRELRLLTDYLAA